VYFYVVVLVVLAICVALWPASLVSSVMMTGLRILLLK
jgi:hypothetical protein